MYIEIRNHTGGKNQHEKRVKRELTRPRLESKASCVTDILYFTLWVSRHLLVEEQRHGAAIALAVDACYVRLAPTGGARYRRRGDLPRHTVRVQDVYATTPKAGGAG